MIALCMSIFSNSSADCNLQNFINRMSLLENFLCMLRPKELMKLKYALLFDNSMFSKQNLCVSLLFIAC